MRNSCCYLIYRKKNRKDHERQMGAGQKGFIPTPLDKLLFILLYLKCYPTYDLQGLLFGLDTSFAPIKKRSIFKFNSA
ncbi:transposase family protein [Arsenophonus sp. ENCA]|uniref:transposase family protein n=1 Tax=Arsenophonus sp. ENCA TaxID=1987579 RepID=UPI0025C16F71|nr:transposase family protein [Arsenophonus sp. ENCA]